MADRRGAESTLMNLLPDGPMRRALLEQAPGFAESILRDYFAADELTQSDMRAFFESDCPRRIHEAQLRESEGTPSSADLVLWLGKYPGLPG